MAQIQASRASTFERILNDIDLPDLPNGYFSHPVDDFFGEYVDALGQRGLQGSGSLELSTAPDGGQYHSVQMPQDMSNGTQSRLALPTAMSLDLPLIPDVPAEPTSTGPMDYPNTMYPNPVPNSTAMPAIGENYHLQAQPNSEQSGSGGQWPSIEKPTRKVKARKQKEADYNADSPGFLDDSDDGDGKAGGGKGTGKTKRNPKQQAQNKQAQQRYRERRKQRFTEMEHTIDNLSAQLEQMQAVQNQNAFLQARRSELESRLSQKEEEVERLKVRLETGSADEPETDETPEQRRKTEDAKLRDCQASVAAHIQELSTFLKDHGLENVNPTGEGTDPQVVQQLAELVNQGCSTCHNAIRVEGVKVLRLMSTDVSDFSRIKCMRKKSKMSDILQRLCLTDLQKEQLKLMRQNHLRNLRAVYEARQHLNMQAMSLMLPPASEHKDLDGKMACMSLSGYGKCARQTVDLDEILNNIKENLRLEQKQVMEMNFVTMHRLLSPIQGAFYLIDMHPAFCDALELANALVSQEKAEQGEPSDDLDKPEQYRSSPTSSDNKSDTCPLMEDRQSHSTPARDSSHAK